MTVARPARQTLAIGLVTVACVVVLAVAWSGERRYAMLSLATGYTAALLLAATLLVTPLYRLRRRRPAPPHLPLRRRLGVHAAILAGIHMALSFPVHMGGDILRYFFADDGLLSADVFVLSNWVGLAGIVLLVVLLVTSTDGSLRRLGVHRWKRLHQIVFLAAAATVAHALGYQWLRDAWALMALLVLAVAGSIAVRLASRRYDRRPGS